MERKFSFCEGEFYHVYNRGTDKRDIFMDHSDYEHFLKLLFLCNSTKRIHMRRLPHGLNIFDFDRPDTLIDIGLFTLMPNHFHLMLHEKKEGGIAGEFLEAGLSIAVGIE